MVEITTTLVVATGATRSHFGDNYTAGLVVHEITVGVVVAPSQKSTKIMWLSINKSTVVVAIVTIVIRIKMPDGV